MGLLRDMVSFVETAKKRQEAPQLNATTVPVLEQWDELVLKAFKVVTRAVCFLDLWSQDAVPISCDLGSTGSTGNNKTLTYPSDSVDPSVQLPEISNQGDADAAAMNDEAASIPPAILTGKSQCTRKLNIASEHLNAAHDSFLGFIGSFIELQLQSRSSKELTLIIQQSILACRQLLAIVEQVWERDSRQSEPLEKSKESVYMQLVEFIQATKDMFSSSESTLSEEPETMAMPYSAKQLIVTATSCVRCAGDCVAMARLVIERIGDFEFLNEKGDLTNTVFEKTSWNA